MALCLFGWAIRHLYLEAAFISVDETISIKMFSKKKSRLMDPAASFWVRNRNFVFGRVICRDTAE